MKNVFKRGKIWHYDFWIGGNRHRGSTGLTQKTLANEAVEKMKQDIREQRVGIIRPKTIPTLAAFVPRFLREIQDLHPGEPEHNTTIYYRTNCSRLSEFKPLAESRLDRIDEAAISDYMHWRLNDGRIDQRRCKVRNLQARPRRKGSRPPKAATVNRELATLKRLLRLARRQNLIPAVPYIQLLKEGPGRDRVVSHHEEDRYLQVAVEPLRDIATIITDCGLRPDECFRMQAADVKFGTETIYIPWGKTPYARRHVPMTGRVRAILEMRIETTKGEKWLFPASTKSGHIGTVKKKHARALKMGGIEKPFVLYSLRHTYGTRLGEAGADAFTIQKLMGHSSVLMSQRYVHPSPERVKSAVRALEAYNRQHFAELGNSGSESPQFSPQRTH